MSPLLLSIFLAVLSFSAVVFASEAWPEPASSILSQIQEAEREYLAAAATGNSNDPCRPISPCRNGGTCISEAGGFFYCACADSFIGRDCGFAAPNANTNAFNANNAEKQPKVMHVQGVRSRVAAVANAAAAAASATSSSSSSSISSSSLTDNNNINNNNKNIQSAGSAPSADDYCARFSPCLHGGMCQSITGGYKCICKSGWVGHDCALALDTKAWSDNNGNTKQ